VRDGHTYISRRNVLRWAAGVMTCGVFAFAGSAAAVVVPVKVPAHAHGGQTVRVHVRSWNAKSCRVTLKGPRRRPTTRPRHFAVRGPDIRIRWRVASNVARGTWRVAITCFAKARGNGAIVGRTTFKLQIRGRRGATGRSVVPGSFKATSRRLPSGFYASRGEIPSRTPSSTPVFHGVAAGLGSGQTLPGGHILEASNKIDTLAMQTDGNLVLYTQGVAVWASNTAGYTGARAVMQSDGNLVVYGPGNDALWSSGTAGHPGSALAVQDDGNVVIYDRTTAIWATRTVNYYVKSGGRLIGSQFVTSRNGRYRLIMQDDGNLVAYTANGRALWATNTAGHAGARIEMQGDGNLVVYSPDNHPLWASNTAGHDGARVVMQADGNVVVYSPANKPLWASGSIDSRLDSGETLRGGQVIYAPGERYHLGMQGDGNLVLYGPSGALWSSRTAGHPGARAVMQADGNLVVYSPANRALWASGTQGRSGTALHLQDDGNVVIYVGTNPIWATNTTSNPRRADNAGASTIAEGAARGAEARLGQVYTNENRNAGWWSGFCENFVEVVYGHRFSYGTALGQFSDRSARREIHGGVPPRGAIVFYGGSSAGHVAISVGGGYVVSTLGWTYNRYPISRKAYTYFPYYYGWAMPY
jgi:hypothetical protein